jgi:glycyl-tRNA synthetase beta chain
MPQLLLELFSEEIPARMQAQAGRDLERMVRERLAEQGILPEAVKSFAGPRRLTLIAEGLPPAQDDRTEERKGPRANAPEQALAGFLRSTGLAREQLIERDGVLYATIHRPGRPTAEIIAEIVEAVVRAFPWPKSMRSGSGQLRWVRPLKRILCTFDGEVIPFEIEGIKSGDLTEGHRFMGSRGAPIRARGFDDYAAGLERAFVVLDPEERKARILEGARTLCFARGLELVEDPGLLDEVAGLAEWPTPVLGEMDPAFLDLPPEVIRTSMRTHQKYFAVRAAGSHKSAQSSAEPAHLSAHFCVVANIEAADGGAAIAAGNAKVLSARLSDARFFWDEDRRVPLAERLKKLKGVTFHARLGTMYQRVERIEALAREIAPLVGADPERAAQAARLCKADLATAMVGEFPELQGVMGGYYARAEGLGDDIADAIRDHYRPQGPSDAVPTAPVTVAVALADKLDTLVGFFAIDEKPTGSRDPFALRRAALGVIRIVLENGLRLALGTHRVTATGSTTHGLVADHLLRETGDYLAWLGLPLDAATELAVRVTPELAAFFADRLKVLLREQGRRHDLVDAVFALGDDDFVRIVARVEALDGFLRTEDGANLLAGYRRAVNILKAEGKKGGLPEGAWSEHAAAAAEEGALAAAVSTAEQELEPRLDAEDFAGAMASLAALRTPVDAFFDKVLVNDPDAQVRAARLRLLGQVRDAMNRVADFGLISAG